MNDKEVAPPGSTQAQLFAASEALAKKLTKDQEDLFARNGRRIEEPGYAAVAFKSDVMEELKSDLTLRFGNPIGFQHDQEGTMYVLRQFGADLQRYSRDYFIFSDCIVTVLPGQLVSGEQMRLYDTLIDGNVPELVALEMLSELNATELTEDELTPFQVLLDSLELDNEQELSELADDKPERPDLRIVRDE